MKTIIQALSTLTIALSFQAQASIQLDQKIVGGVEASIGEFPSIVSLHSSSGSHFCGGSLIKKNWVLTAAHCAQGASIKKVLIGLHDRTDLKNAEAHVPKQIIVHPQYNGGTFENDFALVELSKDSSYAPIELNAQEIQINEGDDEILAITAGWGALKEGQYGLPNNLQKVEVPLVSQDVCNKSYTGKIKNSMICAGYPAGGKDSCQGDSGGPLLVKENGNQVLVGVVSWGYGCARPDKYGVYSKVNSAMTWINKTIN